jgi:hypothetical protein
MRLGTVVDPRLELKIVPYLPSENPQAANIESLRLKDCNLLTTKP